MANTKLTEEQKNQIVKLYRKLGNKQAVAHQLGLAISTVKDHLRRVDAPSLQPRRKVTAADVEPTPEAVNVARTGKDFVQKDVSSTRNQGEINFLSTRFRTLDEWLQALNIDAEEWAVDFAKPNSWQVPIKLNDQSINVVTVYQFKASLRRIKPVAVLPELKPVIFRPAKWSDLPKRMSTKVRTALIWPDMQVGYERDLRTNKLQPFHDRQALDVMFQVARDLQPDVQINLGDNMDNPDLSVKFQAKPEHHRTMQATVFELGWIYAQQRAAAPNSIIHWLRGNHDERFMKYVCTYMQAMYEIRPFDDPDGAPLLSLERLFGLDALKVILSAPYPHGQVQIADWLFHHGYMLGAGSGKTATKVVNDTHHNQGQGHGHRVEIVYKTFQNIRQMPKVYCAAMFGTLAHVLPGRVPAFSPRLNWQQGGGQLTYLEDGSYSQIQAFLIQEGHALFNGQFYEARPETDIVRQLMSDLNYDFSM